MSDLLNGDAANFYRWLGLLTRAELEAFIHWCHLRRQPPTATSATLWLRYERAKTRDGKR